MSYGSLQMSLHDVDCMRREYCPSSCVASSVEIQLVILFSIFVLNKRLRKKVSMKLMLYQLKISIHVLHTSKIC